MIPPLHYFSQNYFPSFVSQTDLFPSPVLSQLQNHLNLHESAADYTDSADSADVMIENRL